MGLIIIPGQEIDPADLDELAGSPQEEFGDGDFTATQKFKVPWEKRFEIATKFKGVETEDILGNISYQAPKSYVHYPRASVLTVGIEPWGGEGDEGQGEQHDTIPYLMKYDFAVLTIKFSTRVLTWGEGSENDIVYVEESIEPFTEYVTLAPGNGIQRLYWTTPGENPREPVRDVDAPGKPIRGLNFKFKIRRIRKIPQQTIDFTDCINQNDVTSPTLGITFAAKTLLYKAPVMNRTISNQSITTTPTGQVGTPGNTGGNVVGYGDASLEYSFTYRRQTWEKFIRPGYATPQFIYDSDGVQYKPFEYKPFEQLVTNLPPNALPPRKLIT